MNRLKKLPLPLLSLLCAIVLTACAPQPSRETADAAADSACVDTLLQERMEGDFHPEAVFTANQQGYLVCLLDRVYDNNKIVRGANEEVYQLDKKFRLLWKTQLKAGCIIRLGEFITFRGGYIGINPGCKRNLVTLNASGKITGEKETRSNYLDQNLTAAGNELVYFAALQDGWEQTSNRISLPLYGMYYIRTDSLGNELESIKLPGYQAELIYTQCPIRNGNHIAGISKNRVLIHDLSGKLLAEQPLVVRKDPKEYAGYSSLTANTSGGLAFIRSYNSHDDREETIFSYDSTGHEVFHFTAGKEEAIKKMIRLRDNNFLAAAEGETLILYVISAAGQVIRKTDTGLRDVNLLSCTESADGHIAIMCSRRIRRYAHKIIFQEYDAAGKKVCRE